MKKILIILAAAVAFVACENNSEDNLSPLAETSRVTATIGDALPSRTVGNSWSAGDEIGITSCVGPTASPQKNLRYTTDGSSSFTGNPLYYYTGMVLKAYYPFAGTEGTAPGNAGVVTAHTRIANQQQTTQHNIDFLWDSQGEMTTKDPNVNFSFAHKMSKITFVFKETSQTKVTDIEGYELIGLKQDGLFDTNTGVCAAKSDAVAENIRVDIEKGSLTHGKETTPLIFFPQAASTNQVQLMLYLNEIEGNTDPDFIQRYICSLKFDGGELKGGHHYKFYINISKAGLNIGNVSIEDWGDEVLEEDTATLDGTPFDE